MNNLRHHIYLFLGFLLCLSPLSHSSESDPFQSCPTEAFLIQGDKAKLYGVDLATGGYNKLSSTDGLGTDGVINGIGFNYHDNFIYGWSKEWKTVIKIGQDYQASSLTITNNPVNDLQQGRGFYIGDIAVNENAYYIYHPSGSSGLYKIPLDPQDDNYLTAVQIADHSQLAMTVFDFAFHPSNGFLYTVDSSGELLKIDATDGAKQPLGNVGQSGTFGAVYFDVDGILYISRNTDGHIYKINVDAYTPIADFFAYGPSSTKNDGARCAISPLIDETKDPYTDFGDAPDSYNTTIYNSGAVHGKKDNASDNIHLGSSISYEHNAKVYPAEDEYDDGLVFNSPLIAGQNSLLQVQTTGSGYLNVWVDFNRDGAFDNDEQLISDRAVNNGTESFTVQSPADALNGYTWVRARLSEIAGIGSGGGVPYGETEDYRVYVTNPNTSQIQDTPFYIAFEDSWPEKGDYDMNDVVVKQESSVTLNNNQEVTQIEFSGLLKAMGASYRNGFGIQLDNILPSNVNQGSVTFSINGVLQNTSPIESDTEFLVIKITEDIKSHIQMTEGCQFYKTETGCPNSSQFTFSVTVPFINPIAYNDFPVAPYNPFIFAMPSMYHGDNYYHPGRTLEIHLKNKMPTSKADINMFGDDDDRTNVAAGTTYQTATGLPWALKIAPGASEDWKHPRERIGLLKAYPEFKQFVDTEGEKSSKWFLQRFADTSKVINY